MFSHFVVRAETMTEAERRAADEQMGILARELSELCRGVAGRVRALRRLALSALGVRAPDAGRRGEPDGEARPRAACADPCRMASTECDVL
jgi:hypothetical protein